jgi:methylated-DNA-[protein]-cysteine S-methyltransferase
MLNLFLKNSKNISQFKRAVYEALLTVPLGKVISYGDLAKKAGFPKAARAVGSALQKNPFAPEVPCHRVVKSNGEVGKFAHGTERKIAILRSEGVEVKKGRIVGFESKKV